MAYSTSVLNGTTFSVYETTSCTLVYSDIDPQTTTISDTYLTESTASGVTKYINVYVYNTLSVINATCHDYNVCDCTLKSNPDIAGIGVSFIPFLGLDNLVQILRLFLGHHGLSNHWLDSFYILGGRIFRWSIASRTHKESRFTLFASKQ